jgi:hypothetical protein
VALQRAGSVHGRLHGRDQCLVGALLPSSFKNSRRLSSCGRVTPTRRPGRGSAAVRLSFLRPSTPTLPIISPVTFLTDQRGLCA